MPTSERGRRQIANLIFIIYLVADNWSDTRMGVAAIPAELCSFVIPLF